MAHSTLRRGAFALGASALIGLALAAPATARPVPGPSASIGVVTHGPAYNSPDWQRGHASNAGPALPVPRVSTLVDDNAVEYLQVGAGALAGMALAGATAVVVGRRHRAHPTPA